MATADWLPCFDRWEAAGGDPVLARQLVHKARVENVLVGRVESLGEGAAVQLRFPQDHSFFFEHEIHHVPGLALIEAGRQVGLAVAHLVYGVPLDGFAFLIHDLTARFERAASLDQPVFGRCVVSGVTHRKGTLNTMTCEGHYLQGGAPIGTLAGSWTILPAAVAARLERRTLVHS